MAKYIRNIVLKLAKIKATPYALAAGFACGAAVSFTPFVGFHTILAICFAFIIHGNLISALMGTVVGNPWSFALIWPATLFTGKMFLGMNHDVNVHFESLFSKLMQAIINLDFRLFVEEVWPLLFPMIIGCIPYCILAWVICYYAIKKAMNKLANSDILRSEK